MKKKIKNIIFDLGGVLLQLDYQKTEDEFGNLGVKDFASYFKQDFASKLFADFETGKIDTNTFYNQFRITTKTNLTNSQIKNAWNAMLLSFWGDRLSWLKTISKKHPIFLLSNTNEIHYHEVINIYNQQNLAISFDSYFVKDYYSHILGLRKPNIETYLAVLNRQGLIANETLFIDDTIKNIIGAKKAGMQTFHLLPQMNLIDEIETLLLET